MTALLDEHPYLGVECVLRELHIASSTYYRWCRAEREPCTRKRQDAVLTERIRQIHTGSGGIYGSLRVHAVLKREGRRADPGTEQLDRFPGGGSAGMARRPMPPSTT